MRIRLIYEETTKARYERWSSRNKRASIKHTKSRILRDYFFLVMWVDEDWTLLVLLLLCEYRWMCKYFCGDFFHGDVTEIRAHKRSHQHTLLGALVDSIKHQKWCLYIILSSNMYLGPPAAPQIKFESWTR